MILKKIPQNPDEWKAALAVAHVLLRIDSARKYGLISGGPAINPDMCQEMISEGGRRGFIVSKEEVDQAQEALLRYFTGAGPESLREMEKTRERKV